MQNLYKTCGSITSQLNCTFSSSDTIYMTYQVFFFFLHIPSDSLVAILMIDGGLACNPIFG